MRILSGIQPSGALHLGNYFGMMRPAVELQEKGETYYFIANYHSMTSLFDAEERRKNTLDVALDFLACGLDPKKSVFFRQSDVPEVTELAWMPIMQSRDSGRSSPGIPQLLRSTIRPSRTGRP